ncbi:MAG: FAD-binding oxidoreductase [Rhodobiaceae bacterium]|nr:FAD-binding oxidoreductase [Rhodobiaceae bacterium]MCC0052832.1 FAD-binding oxidoreductase [Rhodobiaceae bacterium]
MSLFAADCAAPGHPYWWDGVAAFPQLPDRAPETCDVLIVGAGYTGLSAAIVCADAGARVTVVDAGAPGQGASSRNGGMFGAHPRLAFETVQKHFGIEVARGIYAEASQAYAFTRGLIEREAIDCDFTACGRIQMAWTPGHFAAQKRLVANIKAVADFNMEIVDRDALASEIRTDRYYGAILFPEHGGLQPRKFHDGLLKAVLARGVTVVRDCPVEELARSGADFVARTPAGDVRAQRAIMATNGYTRGGHGWLRRRVFPLPSYLIATEPLDAERIAALAPGRRMMVETRARHSYFRVSPEGSRIVFGGRAAITQISPQRAAARLHETMCGIWPSLRDVRLTHCWSGNTGFSFNHMPHVGSHDGVFHAIGFSGSGVVMAPYLGMKVAYQMLGDERGQTAYSGTHLATRPYHFGGSPWFLHPGEFWYRNVVDRREDAEAQG